MANNITYDGFTQRINLICYKLEHYSFLTKNDREKLELELKDLVRQRSLLLQTLEKDKER